MTTVFFSDLDNTLVFSKRALKDTKQLPAVRLVEETIAGHQGFMSETVYQSLRLFDWFIPVTSRTRNEFNRIRFPFQSKYEIVANGAQVFIDGIPDREWLTHVKTLTPIDDLRQLNETLRDSFEHRHDSRVREVRLVADSYLLILFNKRGDQGEEGEIVREVARESGLVLSIQGKKWYLVPDGVTKPAAVSYVKSLLRVGEGLRTIGAGDSVLDFPVSEVVDKFYAPADAAEIPPQYERTVERVSEPGVWGSELILTETLTSLLP